MTVPPSFTEAERLAALRRYDVLDTPPEPAFDSLTRLAAQICEAPIAVINLVEDTRQWFKSEIGLGVRETPIDMSICVKVLLQPGVTVVPDLREDPRFSGNPLVTGEPNLRFYAGALLETPDGYPLGTLCILDYRVRNLTREQEEALEALAGQVIAQLELRRALAQAQASEQALRSALAIKDVLLKEVHHRVKNSLQLVSSLLRLQAREIGDPAFRKRFEEACSRVETVARLHERLYRVDDVQAVEFGDFLRTLCADLAWTQAAAERICLDVTAAEAAIPTDRAVPLALIANELVTNALKHAYPAGRGGTIRIRFERAPTGGYVLTVADDGIGLPDGFDLREGGTLGMKLVMALASQIDGELSVARDGGTAFAIRLDIP